MRFSRLSETVGARIDALLTLFRRSRGPGYKHTTRVGHWISPCIPRRLGRYSVDSQLGFAEHTLMASGRAGGCGSQVKGPVRWRRVPLCACFQPTYDAGHEFILDLLCCER